MKLGPSDPPCREGLRPNFSTYKEQGVARGAMTLQHEWLINGLWKRCDPHYCRECQRLRPR